MKSFPDGYQHNVYLMKLFQELSRLTVLVKIPLGAESTDTDKTCTGMLCLDEVVTYTEDANTPCKCCDCRRLDLPVLQWATVKVVTSARMMSETDIQSLQVRVGFDVDDDVGYVLRGLDVLEYDQGADRCIINCLWHDLILLDDYKKCWKNYLRLSCNVREMYRHSRDKHKLAVVVSHPFGCSKHISFGEWKEQFKLRTIPFTSSHYTKYSYTTPVCSGCEGAPVLILGSGLDSSIHMHSYSKNGLHYSGVGVN